jgi:hypothetical protein
MNVQMRVYNIHRRVRRFITHLLVRMYQKKKIALEISARIASVNGPLYVAILTSTYNALSDTKLTLI